MTWIDLLGSNEFLRMLYPETAPVLDAVRLHELILHQDGPSLAMRFDLKEYPARVPVKWSATKSNAVQVRLVAYVVRRVSIKGWASNNVGGMLIQEEGGGLKLSFDSIDCHLEAICHHILVDSVNAYWDEARNG